MNEIAVTVSSLLHHDGLTPADTLPAIRAFHSIRPLSEDEADAIWPLVALRGVVLALSGRQQVRLDAANAYADAALDREFRVLRQAASVPFEVMGECIRRALGFAPRPHPVWNEAPLVGGIADAVILDAGAMSPLTDEGRWLDPAALDHAALTALDGGAPAAIAPAWRPRLTGAPVRTPAAPATVPTSLTLWLARRHQCRRPGRRPTRADRRRLHDRHRRARRAIHRHRGLGPGPGTAAGTYPDRRAVHACGFE